MVILLLFIIYFLNPVRIIAATPQVTNVVLNNSQNINLIENTITTVSWTAVVTDADGAGSINTVSGLLYRSGVANGISCTPDDHNCYRLASESFRTCDGNSCNVTFNAYVNYYADPTDTTSAYASQYWIASVTAADTNNNIGKASSPIDTVDVVSLSAVGSDNITIAYTTPIVPGGNTGSSGTQITIKNTGNIYTNGSLLGDDLCYDYPQCLNDKIPVGNIRVGLSADYASGTPLTYAPYSLGGLNTLATVNPYIGFSVPLGKKSGTYSTQITYMANQPSKRPLGAMCTQTSDCETGSCLAFYRDADGDGFGQNTSVNFCSTGTPPWGYINTNGDADDSQYCPGDYYIPGTCQKCSNGAIVLQTSSEDLYNDCSSSQNVCQQDYCSGTAPQCSFQPSSLTCRASAGDCDIAENCTGSSFDCPADTFQSTSYNPGGTCQKCTGSSAQSVLQTASEDLFNQCAIGADGSDTSCRSNSCSGSSAACGFLSSANICRTAKGNCDLADACTGAAFTCPLDEFVDPLYNISLTCQMCTGSSATSVPQPSGVDQFNQCSAYGCSSYTYGWSGASCLAAASTTLDGDCDGLSACTTLSQSCNTAGTALASCGSSGCNKSTACGNLQSATANDTAAEICYTDNAQHGCAAGYGCNASGTCTLLCSATGTACSSDAACCTGICGTDADNDGYFSSAAGHTGTCQSTAKPYTDCYDSNANVYPNQTNNFATNRGDGSFDYNCDGVATKSNSNCYSGGFTCWDSSCKQFICNCSGVASCGVGGHSYIGVIGADTVDCHNSNWSEVISDGYNYGVNCTQTCR